MNTKHFGLLAATIAVIMSSGTFLTLAQTEADSRLAEDSFMFGHVEGILKDSEGNVKQYVQSDNKIVGRGVEILATETFGITTDIAGNATGSEGAAEYIQIGTDGESTATIDDTTITLANAACAPVQATKAFPNTGYVDNAGAAQLLVRLTATISDNDCANASTDEVGLFDGATGTGTDELFARNAFTAVNYQTGDSLDLTWDITINGN